MAKSNDDPGSATEEAARIEELERQLRQAERLAAVGLTAGA